MLILASRFLWFHFVQLIEKKKALPQNIDQQYIMNVFHHVSKSSKPGQRDNKIDDDLLQETAEILNLNAEKFPVRVSQISKYHANQFITNIENHLKHNTIHHYTLKYLMWTLKESIKLNNQGASIKGSVVRQLCWKIIYNVCWNRDFDFDPPESIKDIFDRVHDDFIGFFGEFQKDEYGLRKDEAIRYIYHLMVNMKGNHSMKLIPQSSFTVKSITIDKEVCNSIKSAVERRKRKYIKQKLKKKKKKIKKKKKEIKKKKEKLDKNDLFKSIFIVDEPKNCKLTLIRSNGVDIDFVFERVDSQRKRKFEKIDDSDRPLKRLKNNTNVMVNNTNVMVNNTNVMVNNTNVMVNNTNVRVNNTNVMVNERITGVDLGRKDLFVSISHPNKAQCVVKEWSNGQYQFESGLAIWNSQLKRWKRKDRGIRIFEADLSDDTAIQSIISEQSMKHLHYVFEKLWIVTKFYFKRRHRRHLFWLYNRRQKALNKLCRVMAANSDIVAIGDPKFSASSRGYAPAPTVAVVKELQRLCPRKVVLIDEYNTSKLCSLCYSPLKQTKTEGRVNWRVQRCNNCGVYWNRDVNAARNMRALYVYQRDNNGARIPAFERPE
jgi:hypothetical protein